MRLCPLTTYVQDTSTDPSSFEKKEFGMSFRNQTCFDLVPNETRRKKGEKERGGERKREEREKQARD